MVDVDVDVVVVVGIEGRRVQWHTRLRLEEVLAS